MTKPKRKLFLIGGLAGSGKSSLAASLAECLRDEGAVLVLQNGTGDYAQLFAGLEGVAVKRLAGGCPCCSAAWELLAELLEVARLDTARSVILEVSAVTDIRQLMSLLVQAELGDLYEMASPTIVVDPRSPHSRKPSPMPLVQRLFTPGHSYFVSHADSAPSTTVKKTMDWLAAKTLGREPLVLGDARVGGAAFLRAMARTAYREMIF